MQTHASPSSTQRYKTPAEKAAEKEKRQREKEQRAAVLLAEQKERERRAMEKAAEKAAEKEKKEAERKAKEAAKKERERLREEQKRKKEEEKRKKDEEQKKKDEAQSKMNLMNYFSPIKKEPPKEEKGVTHDDPKLASFYNHFRPFEVKLTMTMAPINRFEHSASKDFNASLFDGSSPNFSEIPLKTAEHNENLRNFLSIVNKKLLKKRGARKVISVKDLMQGRLGSSAPEPVVANMEIDTKACDPAVASSTDNDKMTMDSEVESSFIGDPSDVLKDLSKIKMKLLQFYEDFYRPAYYGTWTKKSKAISGRRPFGRDTDLLNYEYDKAFSSSEDEDEDDWLVPEGYLSEDEGMQESDAMSSETTPTRPRHSKKSNQDHHQRRPKIVQPLKSIAVGSLFEDEFGDKNHPLAEYQMLILTKDSLPLNPFADTQVIPNETSSTLPIVIKSNIKGKGRVKPKESKINKNNMEDSFTTTAAAHTIHEAENSISQSKPKTASNSGPRQTMSSALTSSLSQFAITDFRSVNRKNESNSINSMMFTWALSPPKTPNTVDMVTRLEVKSCVPKSNKPDSTSEIQDDAITFSGTPVTNVSSLPMRTTDLIADDSNKRKRDKEGQLLNQNANSSSAKKLKKLPEDETGISTVATETITTTTKETMFID
ncbi:5312_t:CDS:10 [Ambispora leptoticha]|uniref:5312_t:CDS:1 n=1 Tax=Ambispora leptoticha TaxID=144679 RepID=A0A9N8ZT99_9GLOM|nr:5312_t:CDS:10 [Ambispora leptoticha]